MTIESLLFAALGFLVAGLLTIVTAPLFWARAVRLTTRDIKSRMALTEREIEADRGRMRAEHAVLVHGLESRLSTLRSHSYSARVEINRRDARISELTRELEAGREALETSENARRVLERTIVDRVPDVERHLREARSQLAAGEAEAQTLRAQVSKAVGGLDEALEINDQQRAEIGRLKSRIALLEDDVKERDALQTGQPRTSEGAMRAELSMLRAKSRDQANLIGRLQRVVGNGDRSVFNPEASEGALAVLDSANTAAPLSLQSVEAKQKAAEGRLADRDRQIRVLEAEVAALREIAKQNFDDARASAAATDGAAEVSADHPVASDALRALEDAREGRVQEQEQTIRRLRAELAASNDRLARELAKMKDELRRYSHVQPPRGSSAEQPPALSRSPRRSSLTRRVAEDVPDVLRTANANGRAIQPPASARSAVVQAVATGSAVSSDSVAPRSSPKPLKTLDAAHAKSSPEADGASANGVVASGFETPAQDTSASKPVSLADAGGSKSDAAASSKTSAAPRRGLLARISELDRGR